MASDCAYALTAARARRLLRNERAIRRVNRATGGVMVGAGTAIALS
jgi:threonine/homoserine/homoserine lactone efflux protein